MFWFWCELYLEIPMTLWNKPVTCMLQYYFYYFVFHQPCGLRFFFKSCCTSNNVANLHVKIVNFLLNYTAFGNLSPAYPVIEQSHYSKLQFKFTNLYFLSRSFRAPSCLNCFYRIIADIECCILAVILFKFHCNNMKFWKEYPVFWFLYTLLINISFGGIPRVLLLFFSPVFVEVVLCNIFNVSMRFCCFESINT